MNSIHTGKIAGNKKCNHKNGNLPVVGQEEEEDKGMMSVWFGLSMCGQEYLICPILSYFSIQYPLCLYHSWIMAFPNKLDDGAQDLLQFLLVLNFYNKKQFYFRLVVLYSSVTSTHALRHTLCSLLYGLLPDPIALNCSSPQQL